MKFSPFQQLKDKLLPKGEGGLQNLPLCAYGKLKLYKDYINLECDGPAEQFKKWLDEAFGATFEEFGGKSVTLDGPRRLFWNLPSGKQVAVAVVWPSTDEGGLRKFPFSFFTILPRGTFASKSILEGWMTLAPVWIALEQQYIQSLRLSDIDSFYAEFQGRKLETGTVIADLGPDLALDEWLKALYPASPQANGEKLARSLAALITAYREFPEEGEGLAVRLPLSPSIAVPSQIYVWERIFSENLKKCYPWPSMILPSMVIGDHPTLCLIWRDPRREDSRLFARDHEGYDYVEDLAAQAPDGAGDLMPRVQAPAMDAGLDGWIAALGRA